jgi:hypothetical protein
VIRRSEAIPSRRIGVECAEQGSDIVIDGCVAVLMGSDLYEHLGIVLGCAHGELVFAGGVGIFDLGGETVLQIASTWRIIVLRARGLSSVALGSIHASNLIAWHFDEMNLSCVRN